jgi:thermitase
MNYAKSLIISFFFFLPTVIWGQHVPEHVPGRLLIQPLPVADSESINQALTTHGARVHHQIASIKVSVLEVPAGAEDAIAEALTRTGLFNYVERDFAAHAAAIPNDPDFASQWHLATIQAAAAWDITTGSTSAPIAIIDSGVDPTHPDLASKLLSGWSFLTGSSNTADVLGHGTAVAGAAAAATNNGTGVAGVAWSNPILPLVVLDSGDYATYSNIASAIEYAADHGARIISISLGGSSPSSTLQTAVDYAWNKGAVIFAAAANYSSSTPYYPAACNNVLAISATEANDTFSSFSNYGSWVDLSAPGDYILTTNNGGGYGSWGGTSLATPIAAAVGALALSANPSLTNSALVSLLENNSDDLGTAGFDQYFGWGRVNAYKAVLAAKNTPISTGTPPTVSIGSPSSNQIVAGAVSVQGTATDNAAVTKIELDVDGVAMAAAGSSPFSFGWNSTSLPNGSHTLHRQSL